MARDFHFGANRDFHKGILSSGILSVVNVEGLVVILTAQRTSLSVIEDFAARSFSCIGVDDINVILVGTVGVSEAHHNAVTAVRDDSLSGVVVDLTR